MATTVTVLSRGDNTATGTISRSRAVLWPLGHPSRCLTIQCSMPVYVKPATTTNITPTTATVVELKPERASPALSTGGKTVSKLGKRYWETGEKVLGGSSLPPARMNEGGRPYIFERTPLYIRAFGKNRLLFYIGKNSKRNMKRFGLEILSFPLSKAALFRINNK